MTTLLKHTLWKKQLCQARGKIIKRLFEALHWLVGQEGDHRASRAEPPGAALALSWHQERTSS